MGSSRSVNFLNYSSSFSYTGSSFSTSSGFAFDQVSGVLIEVSFSITTTGYAGDTQISFALGMVDNNIWGTAILPDFDLSANPTTVEIVGSATGTSTITQQFLGDRQAYSHSILVQYHMLFFFEQSGERRIGHIDSLLHGLTWNVHGHD
ncbi:hypothetical protein E6H13_02545 [Candidatus Bathyarchaeota archaeon]|nr:MAG: hypothetical protein E6H13_02545 [Candidatus Bathyarchaeota archaeon]